MWANDKSADEFSGLPAKISLQTSGVPHSSIINNLYKIPQQSFQQIRLVIVKAGVRMKAGLCLLLVMSVI